jgi:hypothetical protein
LALAWQGLIDRSIDMRAMVAFLQRSTAVLKTGKKWSR